MGFWKGLGNILKFRGYTDRDEAIFGVDGKVDRGLYDQFSSKEASDLAEIGQIDLALKAARYDGSYMEVLDGLCSSETSEGGFQGISEFASRIGIDAPIHRSKVFEEFLGKVERGELTDGEEAIGIADIAQKAKDTKDVYQALFLWGLYKGVVDRSKFQDMYNPQEAMDNVSLRVYQFVADRLDGSKFLPELEKLAAGEGDYGKLVGYLDNIGIAREDIVRNCKMIRARKIIRYLDDEAGEIDSKSVIDQKTGYIDLLDRGMESLGALGVDLERIGAGDRFRQVVKRGLTVAIDLYNITAENLNGSGAELLDRIRKYRKDVPMDDNDRSVLMEAQRKATLARKQRNREIGGAVNGRFPKPVNQKPDRKMFTLKPKQMRTVY